MKKLDIDINNLREKLIESIKPSGWEPALSPFINGLSFDMIMNNLVSLVEANRRFTPKFKDIMNAFIECPYDNVNVIVILLLFKCPRKEHVYYRKREVNLL